jgi:hypothetical protein
MVNCHARFSLCTDNELSRWLPNKNMQTDELRSLLMLRALRV